MDGGIDDGAEGPTVALCACQKANGPYECPLGHDEGGQVQVDVYSEPRGC